MALALQEVAADAVAFRDAKAQDHHVLGDAVVGPGWVDPGWVVTVDHQGWWLVGVGQWLVTMVTR